MNGKSKPDPRCGWREDIDASKWDTDCGEAFTFIEEGPQENGMKFCCYCGKRIRIIRNEER